MAIPLAVTARVGAYIMKQQFGGAKRYPLVLMLEPLFRCNLACVGCGKIDYPDEILNQRLSYEQCMEAIDECGAPVVSVAGGEPLLHRDMPKIVEGFLARKKFVILCTNALLLTKKIDQYKPDPFFTWSIHLDGDQMMHDHSVCQDGVYDIAVKAIKLAKSKGFQCNLNCTLFQGADPVRVAAFFDEMKAIGIDGVTVSPGYAYERAPDQDNFLNRTKTKQLFRDILKLGRGGKALVVHPVDHVFGLPGRQPGLPLHALGQPDPQCVRLAEALLFARRRLRADLQGADGQHRVGPIRRRQLREVRRLHGPLRLRSQRGGRHRQAAAEGAQRHAARRAHRRPDGPRHPAR